MPLLMGWTGMRGVVSLAAALAIPLELRGAPFPMRNLILFITFIVILLTLLLQGLTLPYFIKRMGMPSFANELTDEEMLQKAKTLLMKETLRLLKERNGNGVVQDPHLQRIVEQWEHKLSEPEKFKMSGKSRQAYLELLEEQRRFLAGLNSSDPEIHSDIIHHLVYQIDLEEERIRM